MHYDKDGQNLTGSLMDYALPCATDVPDVTVVLQGSPTPLNPLGIKGAGQGGAIPVPAAITGAVEDALRHLDLRIDNVPFSRPDLLGLIRAASRRQGDTGT